MARRRSRSPTWSPLLRDADLFVLPAKRAPSGDQDGLPNVIMEAASQRLPIVSTRFAGMPEFVRDGIEGALVAGGRDALAGAIAALARDPSRRARLGAAAYERLRCAFGADHGLDLLAGRFGALIGRERVGEMVAAAPCAS